MLKSTQNFFEVQDGTQFKMNYEVTPNCLPTTTLFIHGNLASNRWWYPTRDVIAKNITGASQPGHMVFAEFRGCGGSSSPTAENEITIDRLSNDFIALCKSQNWGKVNLVGHSTGGLIAAVMLAKAPELFHKAVFLDPVGAKGVTFNEAMPAAFEQMKQNKEIVALVMGSTIHNNDAKSDFFRSVVVEDAFKAVNQVGVLILRALDGLNVVDLVKKITHPVLVLHGEHDQLLPMDDSKGMASLMTNAKFEVFMGCGHCANVEDPNAFVAKIQKFLF